jgi:hypothetical protein
VRPVVTILVVVTAGLLAAGVSLTLVGRSRARAERARCQDNLRRIGNLYLLDEAKATNSFPPGTVIVNGQLPPDRRLSWLVPGLARLGHGDLAKSIDLAAPWDGDQNRSAAESFLVHLACPAVANAGPVSAPLHYPGLAGVGPDAATRPVAAPGAGMFRYDAQTGVADVKDGLSNTLMLLETANGPGPWIAGGPTSVRPLDPANQPYLGAGRPFGGCHFGGANTAYADGSGRFIADTISSDVMELLAGIADGAQPILRNP